MLPLISVIVPIYNVEKYLKKCVDSIIAQTYTNIEIILVDDGSPDNCGVICDEYEKKDNRIRVIHKKNGGLSDARNAGLDICRGEYISFIDSDDFVAPYFLEMLYNAITQNNTCISLITHAVNFLDNKKFENNITFSKGLTDCKIKCVSAYEILESLMYQKVLCGAQFYLYKREIFDNLRFPLGCLYEDLATTYKAIIKSNKIAIVDSDVYAYRVRNDSILRKPFNNEKMIIIDITRSLYKDICFYDLKLQNAAASRAFAANYNVFLQVPKEDRESMQKLWNEIKKYRKYVLTDVNINMRIKNRIGVLITYFGMNIAWILGRKLTHK